MTSVLILNWRDIKNPNAGGAEVFAHEIAKRFVLDGLKVIWFSSREKNLAAREMIDGIEIVRKGSWITVYIWAFFYYIFELRRKCDVIVDCQNGIPFFSPFYSSKKILCVVHHVHRQVFKYYSPNIFIKYVGILLESLIPFVYRRSNIVAVSPSTKKALEKTLKVKNEIEIIYNGVDNISFAPGVKSETPLIIYLGRLKKYKNIKDIITSMVFLKLKIKNIKLIIAGEGEERANLQNLTNSLGLEDCVKFEGRVTEERKKVLLQQAWVLTYPSICEVWGISVLEANASGTIAIGSDVAGLRDSIQDGVTGLLYPLSDIQKLENYLYDVLTDNNKRKVMEMNAIEWSKRFHWNHSYQKFKTLVLK